jgi:NAD(P)-dependent dehydrogenase (short-subunit alcohol dehydrogenase family)
VQAWGRVDIVINNAGIVRDAPFEDVTADRLDPLIDVHLRGAFYVTRPAWKIMREHGRRPSPALSVEQVRDHLDEIRDETGYTVPGGPADEVAALFATIMAGLPG